MAKRPTKVTIPRHASLFDALKQKSRGQTALVKLTRADAVALTGMPTTQAEPALKSLVKTYRSHLAVTDEGELVYEFDPSLERRDKVPLREKLAAAGQLAWKRLPVPLQDLDRRHAGGVRRRVRGDDGLADVRRARRRSRRSARRRGGGMSVAVVLADAGPGAAGYARDRYGRPMQTGATTAEEALLPVGVRLRVRARSGAASIRAKRTGACSHSCATTRGA